MADTLPEPDQALAAVADSTDPVERIAVAAEHLARLVLARQGAVRAMIAATIVRPATTSARPGLRFGLIDQALQPLTGGSARIDEETLAHLKRDLSVVMGAEALFSLMDLNGLNSEDAQSPASCGRRRRSLGPRWRMPGPEMSGPEFFEAVAEGVVEPVVDAGRTGAWRRGDSGAGASSAVNMRVLGR